MEENKNKILNVPTLRFKNYDDNYREITLKDVCTLITKGTTPAKFSTNGINFIKIDSLNGNYVDNSKVTHINESIHNTLLSRSILEENDILLAIAGATVGKHCIIQKSNLPANTNQALAIIRLNKHLLPYYLLAFFDTNYLPSYIKLICAASAQPNLNLQQVGQIKLNIPTIQEQEKVCHFIQLLDKRISVQNKIISDLKVLKKELCNKVFSKGSAVRLGGFIEEVTTRNKLNSCENVLSVSNKMGFIKQSEQFEDRTVASENKSNYKVVTEGCFAYNPARINVGSIALLSTYKIGIISPMYVCFKAKSALDSEYLNFYYQSDFFYKELQKKLEGSVRQCLTYENMSEILIPYVGIEEQKAIAATLNKFATLIANEEKYLKSLQKQKSYFLNAMFI